MSASFLCRIEWQMMLNDAKISVMVLLCHSSECGCFACNTLLCFGDFPCHFLFGCQELDAKCISAETLSGMRSKHSGMGKGRNKY